MNAKTLLLDAQAALAIVQSQLPLLKLAGVAGGPPGLILTAAQALLPLIALIPTGELTVEQQAELKTFVDAVTSGTLPEGDEWNQSGFTPA